MVHFIIYDLFCLPLWGGHKKDRWDPVWIASISNDETFVYFLQQFNLNLTSSDRLKLLSVLTHFIEIIHQLPKRKCSHYEPTGINLNKIPPVSIFHEKAPSVIRERITRITLSFQRISYIMRTSSNSQYICSEAMWQNTFESGSFQCSFNTVQLWKNLQNSETTFVKA